MQTKQLEIQLLKYDLKRDYPAKELTNFHVGGPCDFVVYPKTADEIAEIVALARTNDIPIFVMCRGTNLLVSDKGIRGIVIKLTDNYSGIRLIDEITVEADTGALLSGVADFALENSLGGFEFACGIPGGIGGAITMNAGAYDGNMQDVVSDVTAIDQNGNTVTLTNSQMDFAYRHSAIEEQGLIALSARIKLHKADPESIKEKMDDLMFKRVSKQPLTAYSAGSTFKRPDGHFASKLIEDSGLKGLVMGNVAVSSMHSGFVINTGSAGCKEVLDMIEFIKQVVGNKFGVKLEEEVKIVGDFS